MVNEGGQASDPLEAALVDVVANPGTFGLELNLAIEPVTLLSEPDGDQATADKVGIPAEHLPKPSD